MAFDVELLQVVAWLATEEGVERKVLGRNEAGLLDNLAPTLIDGPVPIFHGLIFDADHADFNGDGRKDIYVPVDGSECPEDGDLTTGGQNRLLLQGEDSIRGRIQLFQCPLLAVSSYTRR